jgi:hypothetical protein
MRLGPVRSWAGSAFVLAAGLLVLLPTHDRSVVAIDEGQLAAIADRIARGQILYRDVYTGIFPGVYHVAAWLMAVFGEDLLVLRRAQLVVNASTALCLWRIALRVARPAWAALAPLLYLALVLFDFPGLSMLNYSPLSMLFALAALLALLRYLERGRGVDAVVSGLCLAASALVKQNFGALAVLAVATGLWLGRRDPALEGRSALRALLPFAFGGAALVLPVLLAFASTGALPALLDATLVTIGSSQLDAFRDPLPPIFGPHPDDARFVFLYTPAALFNYLLRGEELLGIGISPGLRGAAIRIAYGGALATLVVGVGLALVGSRVDPTSDRGPLRAVVAFASLLFLGIFPSAIWSHLAFVAAPLLLVQVAVLDRADRALSGRSAAATWLWRVTWCGAALAAAIATARISIDVRRWYAEPLGIARGSLCVAPEQRALLRAATRFLEDCARPGEPVFAAPDLPVLYFLAARPNPTRFDLVIPGNVSAAEIVTALERTGTRCVVYNPRMYPQFRPFAELFPELAGHLESVFRRVELLPGREEGWQGLIRREEGR